MINFILSFNAVMPMFLIIALGVWFKKIFSDKTSAQINKAVFQLFMPVMLFNNIYLMNLNQILKPGLIVFIIFSILFLWLFSVVITLIAEKDMVTRGAMIQCMFRGNYTILGIPIVSSLYGPSETGFTSLLVAVIVPLFNLLAAVTLELFRGSKVRMFDVFIGILKNPQIIGSVGGVLMLMLKIRLPIFLETTVDNLASAAIPLALITIGTSLKFHNIKENRKNLLLSVLVKTVFSPLVILPLGVFIGCRNVELATVMVLFAAPTAVSAYPMAVQMDSDGDLTSKAIVFSTMVSCPSIILFIFILKELALL